VAAGQIGSQALELGLIDQVVMNVVPVVFGSGRPLFANVALAEPPRAGRSAKPSFSLEPSTPSLPCAPNGNRSQPVATVLACSSRCRGLPICERLPLVATARLHKRSILLAGMPDG
jgi:hypothetical protein